MWIIVLAVALTAALVWVVTGVLAWGFYHGALRHACYNWCNPKTGYVLAACILLAPFFFLAVSVVDGWDYWSWKPLTRDERWEIYQSKYSILGNTYENFDK